MHARLYYRQNIFFLTQGKKIPIIESNKHT